MKKSQIIRAWKDEEYRAELTDEQRAQLPEHPAGAVDLDDEALQSLTGGCCGPTSWCTTNSSAACTCPPPGSSCF